MAMMPRPFVGSCSSAMMRPGVAATVGLASASALWLDSAVASSPVWVDSKRRTPSASVVPSTISTSRRSSSLPALRTPLAGSGRSGFSQSQSAFRGLVRRRAAAASPRALAISPALW